MAVTMAWKVFGRVGHRQRESFFPSRRYDWTTEQDGVRVVEIENSDKTGTNLYSIVRITRDTEKACIAELEGQLSDGIFENSGIGRVVPVPLFVTRDREAGNVIDFCQTRAQAQALIEQYEREDRADGVYTPDFYEVAAVEQLNRKE